MFQAIGVMLLCLLLPDMRLQAQTPEQYQASIESKNQELKQLQKSIGDAGAQRIVIQQTLSKQTTSIQGRAQRVKQLDKEIRNFEARLGEIEQQSTVLQQNIGIDQKALATMIRDLQQTSSNNGLKVILRQQDPATAGRMGVYMDHLIQAQLQRIAFHTERVSVATTARNEALKSRNWLQHIQRKALNQQAEYAQAHDISRTRLSEIETSVESGENRSQQLEGELKELQSLLEELEKATKTRSGYFKAGKGSHFWPTWSMNSSNRKPAPVKARFGQARASGKLDWSGMLIGARSGRPVHAIADGEVVFDGKLAGVGTLLVLDHGDGYLSLYGGIRELLVKTRDWVERGATIATVGKSGGPNPQGIYLEIRHNAVPIDPEQWLTARNAAKIAKK